MGWCETNCLRMHVDCKISRKIVYAVRKGWETVIDLVLVMKWGYLFRILEQFCGLFIASQSYLLFKKIC